MKVENPKPYSKKPTAVKRRIRDNRRRLDQMIDDIGEYWGKPVSEWSFEELQKGKPRGPNGKWMRGNQGSHHLDTLILAEAQKRLQEMTQTELGKHTSAAIGTMAALLDSPVHIVRFNAAKYILDQIMGLPVAKVQVQGEVTVKNMLADVIENLDGGQAKRTAIDNVIDAEVVEDEDDDDDDDDEDYDDDE